MATEIQSQLKKEGGIRNAYNSSNILIAQPF